MMKIAIAGFHHNYQSFVNELKEVFICHEERDIDDMQQYLLHIPQPELPDALLIFIQYVSSLEQIRTLKSYPLLQSTVMVLLTDKFDATVSKLAREIRVNDFFSIPLDVKELNERIQFLVQLKRKDSFIERLLKEP